jgi:hypothetical protein
MAVVPTSYPQSVGYSSRHDARVGHGVDANLSLHNFLSEWPLTIIYNVSEALSATPPDDSP